MDAISKRLGANRQKFFFAVLVLPIIFFFNWWNLDGSPVVSGWDEGIYLQFSHHISQLGIFGSTDGGICHWLNPAPATGPTVIYLVALVFKIFGEQLIAARMVIALFLSLTFAGLFLLIRKITRWEIAVGSVFLLMVAGYSSYDTLWLGRQVLFEIPAYAFLFLGYWLLVKALRENKVKHMLASALLLALSVLTKCQLIWVLAPSLGIMFLLDLFYFKQKRWKVFFVTTAAVVVVFAVWSFVALMLVGSESAFYLESQAAAFKATFLSISFGRIMETAKMFVKSGFAVIVGIPFVFVLIAAFKRSLDGLIRALFIALAGFGLINLFIMSLPWARYLNAGIVLSIPVICLFLNDLVPWFEAREKPIKRWTALACWGALAIFVMVNLVLDARLILAPKDDSAAQFAQYIDQTINANEHILNWEWEVEFYSQNVYNHPDFRLFSAMIDQVYNNNEPAILSQTRIPTGTHYVIVGPFALQTQVFTQELAEHQAQVIHQVGSYSLYFIE